MQRATRRIALALAALAGAAAAPTTTPVAFHEDFEHLTDAKMPSDFQVMAGEFTIAADGANHFLELPGDPLDTFGLLFGPSSESQTDVSARIWGACTGQRFPEFGIGCGDVSGCKLWAMPGQGKLELRKGDETRASAVFAWKSGTWTCLRLRVVKSGDTGYHFEGKAWTDGSNEPDAWTISFDDAEAPAAGRASVWGEPFSEKPIRFDDLNVRPTH